MTQQPEQSPAAHSAPELAGAGKRSGSDANDRLRKRVSLPWTTSRYVLLANGLALKFWLLTFLSIVPFAVGAALFVLVTPDPRLLFYTLILNFAAGIVAWRAARRLPRETRVRSGPRWGILMYVAEIAIFVGCIAWVVMPVRAISVPVGPKSAKGVLCREVAAEKIKDGKVYFLVTMMESKPEVLPLNASVKSPGIVSWYVETENVKLEFGPEDVAGAAVFEPLFVLRMEAFLAGPAQGEIQTVQKDYIAAATSSKQEP